MRFSLVFARNSLLGLVYAIWYEIIAADCCRSTVRSLVVLGDVFPRFALTFEYISHQFSLSSHVQGGYSQFHDYQTS